MFNAKNPLSAFSQGDNNAMSFAIAQREENIQNAIAYIISLYDDDCDALNDHGTFQFVKRKYNLLDLTATEKRYIIEAVVDAI